MKNTLIVMSTNREVEMRTQDSLAVLQRSGGLLMVERGSACVAFARCRALSLACELLHGAHSDRDVVLMVDDDMEIDLETAQQVVSAARSTGVATSAAYATVVSRLAGTRWKERPDRWLVGLGCLAIPTPVLLELEQESASFEMNGKAYSEFTWTGAEKGVWVGEDYRLSQRLGGVNLLPLGVGHIKKWRIAPDQETLDGIARGDL
jgi:hypothetical protein